MPTQPVPRLLPRKSQDQDEEEAPVAEEEEQEAVATVGIRVVADEAPCEAAPTAGNDAAAHASDLGVQRVAPEDHASPAATTTPTQPPATPAKASPDMEPPLPPPANDVIDISELVKAADQTVSQAYKIDVLVAKAGGATAVRALAELDDGAMQVVLGTSFYEANVDVFGPLQPTRSCAQLADNRLRPFDGELMVDINVQGVRVEMRALVLRGQYDMLLGKPWLHQARAIHLYPLDWMYLLAPDHPRGPYIFVPNVDATIRCTGTTLPPGEAIKLLVSGGQLHVTPGQPTHLDTGQLQLIKVNRLDEEEDEAWADVGACEEYAAPGDAADLIPDSMPVRSLQTEIDVDAVDSTSPLPAHRAARREEWKPHHLFGKPAATPDRIAQLLQAITFGPHLSPAQKQQLEDLVTRYHAVFGLSAADLASNHKVVFDIELEEGSTCPSFRVRDPKLTPDDRTWLHDYCGKLLDVGILRRVPPEEVVWLSDIKIVPKDKGHWECASLEKARDLANDGLRQARLPFDPSRPQPPPVAPSEWVEPSGRRLVHNYIPLNRRTKNVVPYPVGAMEQKVTSLAGKQYYSSFDMLLGYFAIKASTRAQQYLTFFVEGIGHLTYTRMPFGPVEGPARFNVLGNAVFGQLEQADAAETGGDLVRWMDDLNVASTTFEGHLKFLTTLLELCEDTGVTLSAKKTFLGVSEVKWCGNIISANGVSSDPAKVAAVVRWGPLNCPMDVLRFVNTASFLRSRVPNFAEIAAPLIALSSLVDVPDGVGRRRGTRRRADLKRQPLTWRWTDLEEKSFALTKAAVAFAIASTPADFTKVWMVDSDASPGAFGGALLQPGEGRERRLVAVASKKCSPAESNASQFLRELMAIRFALDRFDPYIKGGRIIVTTDCIGLRDLLNSTDITSTYVRWRESLLGYNIVRFVHRPGKANLLCDGLSRKLEHDGPLYEVAQTWEKRLDLVQDGSSWSDVLPTGLVTTSKESLGGDAARLAVTSLRCATTNNFDQGRVHPSALTLARPPEQPLNLTPQAATVNPITIRRLAANSADQHLLHRFEGDPIFPVLLYCLTGELDERVQHRSITRRLAKSYFTQDGQFYHFSKSSGQILLVVTVVDGLRFAMQFHESEGHYGQELVALRVRKAGLHWASMKQSLKDALASCTVCQQCGPRQAAILSGPVIHPQPFDLLAFDFLKLPTMPPESLTVSKPDLSVTKLDYLCVAVDYFSHFIWAIAVPGTAAGAAHALRRIVCTAAQPRRILTDNGSHFTGREFREACASMGVLHTTSPIYAPWANGLVERNNGELVRQLRKLCAAMDTSYWPDVLETAVSNINRRVIASVGYSPQELLYGTVSWGAHTPAAEQLLPENPQEELPDDTIGVRQTLLDLHRNGVTDARIASIAEPAGVLNPFKAGDLVMQYKHVPKSKLEPRWAGPYRVTKTFAKSVELETLEGVPLKYRHHHAHLRPFQPASL